MKQSIPGAEFWDLTSLPAGLNSPWATSWLSTVGLALMAGSFSPSSDIHS